MTSINANAAGQFTLGDRAIARLGFGAMRLTGTGVWGEPKDRAEALRVLQRLPELGVNFIDTADSYGPNVAEELIAEALYPYGNMFIATKGGLTRTGPGRWLPVGRPEYLRQCVLMSLRRLKVEQLDLWQLHRIDPKVPQDEQFGAVADFLNEGLIATAGLSQVSIAEIEAARKVFPVTTVQNRYNLTDRVDEAVLDYCTQEGIGFIPWFPLAAGDLAQSGGIVETIAKAHGASSGQIALAWILKRSPNMLPIPGTSQVSHLAENVAAAQVELSDDEFEQLDRTSKSLSAV
ncbi:aldo/keto reductase [Chamaesiphon sp.]|uniref:aldo/keto reductase n=1 Tax=Chamaesiphon sp. TaxID=2814140 RepID=UPI0035932145